LFHRRYRSHQSADETGLRRPGFTNQKQRNFEWDAARSWILWPSIAGRLLIGRFCDTMPMKWAMTATYFIVAGSIPLLLPVKPSGNPSERPSQIASSMAQSTPGC
jgi:hypothetical protein